VYVAAHIIFSVAYDILYSQLFQLVDNMGQYVNRCLLWAEMNMGVVYGLKCLWLNFWTKK
jgi:hypothetical protein